MYKYKNLQGVNYHESILLQNLLNFIITKYLKQEVDDDLSIYMDERSPCGLSMNEDVNIYRCLMSKM